MKNIDNSAMSIETLFEKTPYLDVQLAPGQVLLPSNKFEENILEVPIIFTPREIRNYEEKVTFDINNLHKIEVMISGEGIPFKLELEKNEDVNLDFGVVRVNSDTTRVVGLVNTSRKPISVTFDIKE